MARYSLGFQSKTMIAVADTTGYTSNGYAFFAAGGSATELIRINEIYIGGEDTASTPTTMVFARDSTVAATALTTVGNFNAPLDVQTTAPTAISFGSGATTNPQRAATLHLLQPSLNTYGGIARWQARYGEEITSYGTAVNVGEVSLSSVTGTGKVSGHMIYEVC